VNDDELRGVFDRMASGYDSKLARMAPIHNGLYFLLESVLGELPQDAWILCVGVGTGTELIHLAGVFPGWRFTAVEPSVSRPEVDSLVATTGPEDARGPLWGRTHQSALGRQQLQAESARWR